MRVPVACARIPQIQEQLDFRDDLSEWFDPLDGDQASPRAVATLLKRPDAPHLIGRGTPPRCIQPSGHGRSCCWSIGRCSTLPARGETG